MDSIDRSDPNVPARLPAAPARLPVPALSRDLATAAAPAISAQVILRGLTRHWWQVLLLWLVISAPVAYLIYMLVKPTYEAVSILRIEPTQPDLLGPSLHTTDAGSASSRYLQTQVQLISRDQVLGPAVASPLVVNLPTIKGSTDPIADLRKKLNVEIVEDAYLIRVALELPDPEEAATIVSAVVESYLRENARYNSGAQSSLRANLDNYRKDLDRQINEKKDLLKGVVDKGNVPYTKPSLNPNDSKHEVDLPEQPASERITQEHFHRTTDALLQTDLALVQAEAALQTREAAEAQERDRANRDEQQGEQVDAELEERIEEEFTKDPQVAGLIDEIDRVKEEHQDAKKKARQATDPGAKYAQRQLASLMKKYQTLWDSKYDGLKKQLTGGSGRAFEKISELRAKVAELKENKAKLAKIINQMKVDDKDKNKDTFDASFLNYELTSLLNMRETIKRKQKQLEIEIDQETFRVVLVDAAKAPKVPSNNKRLKYMAAAPVGVLFIMLGLFLLLEIKAERVGDPDVLSTRVQSEVYALPPLPTARSARKLNGPQTEDRIEQFIQRLDHLRFAVCGNPSELGQGRCVLITSAIGGEGKTTLAAQLAARCGNAAMSTLLIDADLHRAALCPLLDVPEGPGLSDALQGEVTFSDLVIPVQGGTFYLLPAGTPVQDTSRLLQNHKLGLLIAQCRQLYDLIIIDSPPVLPVPDALILGRWVDGAVLAARYDISRFPPIERARRQLDSAGIAVLGTVINGLRRSDSYYGRYSYSRRRSYQADSSNTI
jgi:polysaccharide biosynthesis transport protein